MKELRHTAPVYILAVSGGVDSMVLAETIGSMRTRRFVIAHFDHGIRKESAQDEKFVRDYAKRRGVPYVTEKSHLGSRASEERARDVRYAFLRKVQRDYNAVAIVTAHHQDDVLETMCINLIRGTGWRGLVSLRSHDGLLRPLLHISKAQIIAYALRHNIQWVEDRTNEDPRYLRNRVRQTVMRKMNATERRELLNLYEKQLDVNEKIESEVKSLQSQFRFEDGISRHYLIMVPVTTGIEILQSYVGRLERPQIARLLHFAKTAKRGKKLTLARGLMARVTNDQLIVYTPET